MPRSPARKAAGKPAGIKVDFAGVETSSVLPEDDYLVEVLEVEQKTSENSGNDYLSITLEVADGQYKGKKLYHNCSLQPQALFNLRGVLEALGFEVPDGVMELDPADMVGERCGVTVAHEKYEGKDRARCVEFFDAAEFDEGGGEEEAAPAPAPAATKVTKKPAAPAPTPAPAPTAVKKKKKTTGGITVGSAVTFTDDEGNEVEGEVKAIEDGNATVLCGDDEWELSLEELTPA